MENNSNFQTAKVSISKTKSFDKSPSKELSENNMISRVNTETRDNSIINATHKSSVNNDDSLKVYIRIRPPLEREKEPDLQFRSIVSFNITLSVFSIG